MRLPQQSRYPRPLPTERIVLAAIGTSGTTETVARDRAVTGRHSTVARVRQVIARAATGPHSTAAHARPETVARDRAATGPHSTAAHARPETVARDRVAVTSIATVVRVDAPIAAPPKGIVARSRA